MLFTKQDNYMYLGFCIILFIWVCCIAVNAFTGDFEYKPVRKVEFTWEPGSEAGTGYMFYVNGKGGMVGNATKNIEFLDYETEYVCGVARRNLLLEQSALSIFSALPKTKLNYLYEDKLDVHEIRVYKSFSTERGEAEYVVKRVFQSISDRVSGAVIYSISREQVKNKQGQVKGWYRSKVTYKEINSKLNLDILQ